ncbi:MULTISPECIES: glutamyl-tRNA reductase [Corynebacterium]|uniref:glutamyl-tRNA reductase n=1 Tax=Corynebacterium TaxID=1716 RepID=UPI0003B8065C|nr:MULTISPECIES: glutamyl-tRNA reductase [Corynebacterium]ERS39446.1 glutamyl-tRNA reductase [Corynebacterium sp. KPL1995]ERS72912.1 glutamyl-tRNA reductase [Corynebacterium sp. KPL1989]MCG7251307.1 glutamyl-tRNA reductase [Corynebacterium pseudodiphtheriticum]MDC7087538.1 glutamyl-tRNA reductase [Corynebacterium pseudodiphtheriticum]MDK4248919.1 glutamyl-tRNA reductase [Corynebacterium pseudodiphtheriticum]
MSVLVVGMSHRSAPVALLERLSVDGMQREETNAELVATSSLSEAMIISTCNRLEVYCVTNSFHSGVQDVVEVLHRISHIAIDELRSYLYVRYADAAAEHMMVVASGLDSMVVGEQQIIGQVRKAYQRAVAANTAGKTLHALAQSALRAGKRVHTETKIDEAGASMVTVALNEALQYMDLGLQSGDASATVHTPDHVDEPLLIGRTALVLGAGAMASLAATHLGRLGVDKIIVANRTRERADNLVDHAHQAGVCAEAVNFEDRQQVYGKVDIIVSATGADNYTVDRASIPEQRHGHLVLIDLSLPRDIADDTAKLRGVDLVNIERLHQSLTSQSDEDTTVGHQDAKRIVREELQAFASEQRVREVVPAVSALRKHAAGVIECEMARLRQRRPHMSEDDFGQVQVAIRRAVDKLLHEPTVRAKKLAAESGAVSHETALQEMFGLEIDGSSIAVDADELPSVQEVIALGNNAGNHSRADDKAGTNKNSVDN